MFILDVETLGVESTSVVLSLAITHVNRDNMSYEDMLDNSLFIKYDVVEQMAKGRVSDDSTCKWWDRQAEVVKIASLIPNKEIDLSFSTADRIIKKWLADQNFGDESIYTRGMLDPVIVDSLYRTFDAVPFVRYNRYLDVRTAISLLYPNSKDGYVKIPGFDDSKVIKHNPVHDCAFDGMMLLYGDDTQ